MGAVTLGQNVSSLGVQRNLADNSSRLSKSFERLSSGLRINSASDDAAGLSVFTKLRNDARVFSQGVRNLNDGISLLNIADGSVETLSNITIRLKELAAQAANGAYGAKQRSTMNQEAQALSQEFTRIVRSTSFNGNYLFHGEFGNLRLQAGYGNDGGIGSSLGGAIGTGTFASALSFLSSSETNGTSDAALGDLNGDGNIDIVTVGASPSASVFVRLGNGNGSFQGPQTSAVTGLSSVQGMTLADVNGDGVLDLLAGGVVGPDGYASVMLGRGDGTFATGVSYASESGGSFQAAGYDVNGDGILDLVTAGTSDAPDGYATIRLGTGNGTFGAATSYATETGASYELAMKDINRDGLLDLVTAGANDGSDGYATVRLGTGGGSFGAATTYAQETSSSHGLALEDVNGDGQIDMITAGTYDAGAGGALTVRLGQSNGTFGTATTVSLPAGSNATALEMGDMNGDGNLDAVIGGYYGVGVDGAATILLGRGDGTFSVSSSYVMTSFLVQEAKLGDVNGDGVPDLVGAGLEDSFAGNVVVRLAETRSGIHPILPFTLNTRADALQAQSIFDRKLTLLSTQRGQIGAFQSRINAALGTYASISENYLAAASRISDVDLAQESSAMTRGRILQQVSAAILGQANLQPQLTLDLLNT